MTTEPTTAAAPGNPLGIHALVWVERWDTPSAEIAVERSAAAGYDLIEVPVIDPAAVDASLLRRHIERAGLAVRCSLGLGFDADVSSDDPTVVRRGKEHLNAALDTAAELGADMMTGVVYSALGKYRAPASQTGRLHSVDALRRIAQRAGKLGITIGMEVVNRYESNLLNTAADALSMLDEIGEDNIAVHLDTYHMNIEEADFYQPVLACGPRLGYVHVGESHRGYLGGGHVDLAGLCRALAEVGYAGPVTFEAFSSPSSPTDLSSTLAVWRHFWDDPTDVAVAARTHLASLMAAAHAPTNGAAADLAAR